MEYKEVQQQPYESLDPPKKTGLTLDSRVLGSPNHQF